MQSNYFGLVSSPFNYPEPGKRPLSSMSPSILVHQRSREIEIAGVKYLQEQSAGGGAGEAETGAGRGSRRRHKVRLVGGGSGGPRIISGVAQVILNVVTLGKGILSSVMIPRLHQQLVPYQVFTEHSNYNVLQSTKTALPENSVRHLLNEKNYDPSVAGAEDRMMAINNGKQVSVLVNIPSDLVASLHDGYLHNVSATGSVGVTQFISKLVCIYRYK